MIDFEHVYKTYETHNDENVALEDINIHIDEGEFVFILGHSGAGKSTFLKLIQMVDEPTGNIDPEMSMDIMQLFEAINKVNITVVVVTHEHELVHKLARKYGNRVITLANGMVASDTADPAAARRYAAAMAEREEDDYEYDED